MQDPHIYTVGHSNLAIDHFVRLISEFKISVLVDIRAYPYSQRYPWFNTDTLRQYLENHDIVYHWAGKQLGGHRQPKSNTKNVALSDPGLRGFADYMQSNEFEKVACQLINLSNRGETAVMCAERLPEHCHRGLLSDYLVLRGVTVMHIVDVQTAAEHKFSTLARRESAALIYDRNVTASLQFGFDKQK